MSLKFNCPECGKEIVVRFLKVGEVAKCPHCGKEIMVPENAVEIIEQKSTEIKSSKEDSPQNTKDIGNKAYISPAGALFAVICFFLPWTKFSCNHEVTIRSGAQIGEELWLVFVAAIIIITAFFVFQNQRKLQKAKLVVILGSIIGIAVPIIKYAIFVNKLESELHMTLEDIGLSIQFGAFGTLLGFAISLIGVPFLKSTMAKTDERKSTVQFCPSCGARISHGDSFCPGCGAKVE